MTVGELRKYLDTISDWVKIVVDTPTDHHLTVIKLADDPMEGALYIRAENKKNKSKIK